MSKKLPISAAGNIAYDDLKRQFFAESPSDVDGVFNASALYYRMYLLRKIFAIFDFKGLPKTWDRDYFLTRLFLDGTMCITDTEMGVLPLRCSYYGVNVFEHPTNCTIANPVLGSFDREIGTDCVLLKLQYDYMGVWPILNRYATLLAMCDSSLSVTLMNSKAAFIGMAESKAQAETMKKMFDDISSGRPAVFVNENAVNPAKFFFNNVKQNFVGEEIQTVKRSIINEFLTEIGINNANTDKRERLNADEVNANNSEIGCNVQHWLDNIRDGLREVKEMFGIDITVTRRDWERGTNESMEPDRLYEKNPEG